MNLQFFEDDELQILIDCVNVQQMCFHPCYASNGEFSINNLLELRSKENVYIIVDKNIVSPICEIAVKGALKDQKRMQKIAMFVAWSKFLNARMTCGIGIMENDSSGLCTVPGEENRKQFLHGVDNIPSFIWKELAFGYIESIPSKLLYLKANSNCKTHKIVSDLVYLCNEVSVVKIVQLLRACGKKPIDKFLEFMNWYADNLDMADSIVIYAAMVFSNTEHIAMPKHYKSNEFTEIKKGIQNQAWDITYIVAWSKFCNNETNDECWMFATDDTTQKFLVVNTIPLGECGKAIEAIFSTKADGRKLRCYSETKLGKARIRPFEGMTENEKVKKVKSLLDLEYESLKGTLHD